MRALARIFIVAFAFSVDAHAAVTLELYVDLETKQLYTEGGPGRQLLGIFQQVPQHVLVAAAAASADGISQQTKEPLDLELAEKKAALERAEADIAQRLLAKEKALEEKQRAAEQTLTRAERAADAFVRSQVPAATEIAAQKQWYERIGMRGYVQMRYNQTLGGDEDAISHWPDRSVGPDNSFLIRRARLIIFGHITDRLYVYLQPDFASTPTGSSTTHFGQLRDIYGDIFLDKNKEFRLRVGQSKIPYSFENLQSSQNRLALDRNDALNSCCRDERDIGAFLYWSPAVARDLFKELLKKELKGSGDYGVLAFGLYNGQGANRFEVNDQMHLVGRFTYPHKFANGQIVEAGIQAIHGRFVPSVSAIDGAVPLLDAPRRGFRDQRLGLHAVVYPQPFGLQAEWNWGRGPQLNEFHTVIENGSLGGGYIQAMYKLDTAEWGTWFPFIKFQSFDGALKFERNAPQNRVRELDIGLEWQPWPELEIVTKYTVMDRTDVSSAPFNQFDAELLRIQLQWNYF